MLKSEPCCVFTWATKRYRVQTSLGKFHEDTTLDLLVHVKTAGDPLSWSGNVLRISFCLSLAWIKLKLFSYAGHPVSWSGLKSLPQPNFDHAKTVLLCRRPSALTWRCQRISATCWWATSPPSSFPSYSPTCPTSSTLTSNQTNTLKSLYLPCRHITFHDDVGKLYNSFLKLSKEESLAMVQVANYPARWSLSLLCYCYHKQCVMVQEQSLRYMRAFGTHHIKQPATKLGKPPSK